MPKKSLTSHYSCQSYINLLSHTHTLSPFFSPSLSHSLSLSVFLLAHTHYLSLTHSLSLSSNVYMSNVCHLTKVLLPDNFLCLLILIVKALKCKVLYLSIVGLITTKKNYFSLKPDFSKFFFSLNQVKNVL